MVLIGVIRLLSYLAALDILQTFFIDNLRLAATEDSRNARCYAYNRWPEDFCSEAGLGYAPKDSTAFLWGIERSGFFNDRGKWVKGFDNQMV